MLVGKQKEIGFSIEGTRGTAESSVSKWMKSVDANIIAQVEKVVDDTSQGRIEDSKQTRVVQKWFEGDIEGVLHVDTIGYLFNNLYGACATTDEGDSVYSHVFTVNNDIDNESLTVFVKDGDVSQQKYNGAIVGSLEISAEVSDLVRFTSTIMARDEESDTETPSYDTEYDFVTKDITVTTADTEGDLATGTTVDAKSMSISWDAGAIRDHVFGAYTPDNIYNAQLAIEGSFEKNYEDSTWRDLWQGDDSKYMEIEIAGTTDLGGGNYPTITILLNKVQVTGWERSGGNDELVTESVDFKAFYNESDEQQSQVTLKNLTQTYDSPYV